MDDKEFPGSRTRGLVATAAIIALLVGVIGIGVADYYLGSSRVMTETSVSTSTASVLSTVTKISTKTTTVFSNSSTTVYSISTSTAVSVSDVQIAPTTTVTVAKIVGNLSQVTIAEAVLYSGKTATSSAAGTASLLIGFYNPNSTTYVTSIVLDSQSYGPFVAWDNSSAPSGNVNLVSFASMNTGNTVQQGLTAVLNIYPVTSSPLTIQSGQIYDYTVFFANGSYLEGSLAAQ